MGHQFILLGAAADLNHLVPEDFRADHIDLGKFKKKYEIRRKNLEENIKDLSLIQLSKYIANLIYKSKVSVKHLLFLINLRLKYKENNKQEEFNQKKFEEISDNLIYCFHYLLLNEANLSHLKENKEMTFQSIIRMYTAQIHRKELPEMEKKFLIDIYKDYNEILEKELGYSIEQIIDFLLICYLCFLKNSSNYRKMSNGYLEISPYLLNFEDLNHYIENNKTLSFKKNSFKKIINILSCKLGNESKNIESLIENTIFTNKLFILNENKIFFPMFTNYYQKLNRVLQNLIQQKYPKKWIKFNQKIGRYVETETTEILESEFNENYLKSVFLDDKYEVDGLIKYKDILLLVECKKRELRDASLRGGIKSIKRDINAILVKSIEQLEERKEYIKSSDIVKVYDSDSPKRKEIFEIKRNEISKIFCFSITFDDISIITGQKFFYNDLSLDYIKDDLISISFKNLRILSILFPQPIVFLNYLLVRNNFLKNVGELVHFNEELDLIGLYLNGLLMRDYSDKILSILDFSKDLRDYFILNIYRKKRRNLNKLSPVFTKYRRFLSFVDTIARLDTKYCIELCLYLLCLREDEIKDFNNKLILKIRDIRKRKKSIKIVLSLYEFKTAIIISLYKSEIEDLKIEKILNKIPKYLRPSDDFKQIFILQSNIEFNNYKLEKILLT